MPTYAMMAAMIFFIILIGGLVHEWNEGSLNWSM